MSWSYASQPSSIRHIGPVSQDFSTVFGLGQDERYISTSDADGVALAAIQGLHRHLREVELDFVMWDYQVQRDPNQGGWFGALDSFADGTCESWDTNEDTDTSTDNSDDDYADLPGGYNLKRPTLPTPLYDPTGTADDWRFQVGDVIPLVWTDSNHSRILNRLADRLNGADPATDPEAFANATYLEDFRQGSDDFLRYKAADQYSLFPNGSTPLGYSLKTFREWYRGCENGSCPNATGWDDIASANDPKWGCRQRYLLVLTDVDDTCPGRDPCSLTASMKALDNIYTYVVAFGVENTAGNRLNCMAANGGTGDPIYPQNKQELIAALLSILGQIREQAAPFASAAVPQVQANAFDKIYLSSFGLSATKRRPVDAGAVVQEDTT